MARRAFTLVELLVVVAIMAALMAILMPSLRKARETALTVKCASGVRQLAQATMAYAVEHARVLPHTFTFGSDFGNDISHSWHTNTHGMTGIRPTGPTEGNHRGGQLWRYAPDEEMYICPVWPSLFNLSYPQAHFASGHTPAQMQPGLSYVMFEGFGKSWNGVMMTRLNQIPYPSLQMLYGEEPLWVNTAWASVARNNSALGSNRRRSLTEKTDAIGGYHNTIAGDLNSGRTNVSFIDGHVALHAPSETKDLAFPSNLID